MTNRETLVSNRIKYFQTEYPDGVPVSILKLELDMSVDELREILLSLVEQGVLFIEDDHVKLVETPSEDESASEESLQLEIQENPSNTKDTIPVNEEDLSLDLTEDESKAFEIIKRLTDGSGHISRHILEGNLLYGDLKLSTLGTYNMIMSLENKRVIKKIQLVGGEYYVVF